MSKKPTDTETRPYVGPRSPDLYSASMDPQIESNLDILNRFEEAFAETSNGAVVSSDKLHGPQFLEVACGPGNFTCNTLLPRYMEQCRRIVAVDKDPTMISFAKLHHEHEKISYQILDIVDGDVESFVREHGLFARVFSFNLLHWVKDRARAMRNIEKLMAPGGECFILFQHTIPMFEFIMGLAESERWKKYDKALQNSIPLTARSTDLCAMRQHLQDLLNETDLKPLACEVLRLRREKLPSLKDATDRLVSFNPIYNLLNDEEKEELFKFAATFASEQAQAIADGSIPRNWLTYVIHAYKSAP